MPFCNVFMTAKYSSDKQGEIEVGTLLENGTHVLTVTWTPNDPLYDVATATVTVEVDRVVTSVISTTEEVFEVYPNPVQNELHVNVDGDIQNITIANQQGQVVNASSSNVLDVSSLPAGIYSITVQTETNTFVEKFVKK